MTQVLPTTKAAPLVFLDKMRLEAGRDFVQDFSESLCRSRVAVVVLSAAALHRMMADQIDLSKHVCCALLPQLPLLLLSQLFGLNCGS